MPVRLYEETNFGGAHARLGPGFFTGRGLQAGESGSLYTSDLAGRASSARVDPGYLAVFSTGLARASLSSGRSRVVVGPAEIADLGALGLDDAVNSVEVYAFAEIRGWAQDDRVEVFALPHRSGRRARLGRGTWSRARLRGSEANFPADPGMGSACVADGAIAIFYADADASASSQAFVVAGPACVEDTARAGFSPQSLSILYVESAARRAVQAVFAPQKEGDLDVQRGGIVSVPPPPYAHGGAALGVSSDWRSRAEEEARMALGLPSAASHGSAEKSMASKRPPYKRYQPQRENMQRESLQRETLQRENLQRENLQQETLQRENLQRENLQQETLQKNGNRRIGPGTLGLLCLGAVFFGAAGGLSLAGSRSLRPRD